MAFYVRTGCANLLFAVHMDLLQVFALALVVLLFSLNFSKPPNPNALNMLRELTRRSNKLIAYLLVTHPNAQVTALLQTRWAHATLRAATVVDPKNIAYVVGKHTITICTQGDIESAFYVLLHELAHLSTPGVDNHSALFWERMDFLVKAAEMAGVYKPIEPGVQFCGRSLHP